MVRVMMKKVVSMVQAYIFFFPHRDIPASRCFLTVEDIPRDLSKSLKKFDSHRHHDVGFEGLPERISFAEAELSPKVRGRAARLRAGQTGAPSQVLTNGSQEDGVDGQDGGEPANAVDAPVAVEPMVHGTDGDNPNPTCTWYRPYTDPYIRASPYRSAREALLVVAPHQLPRAAPAPAAGCHLMAPVDCTGEGCKKISACSY